MHVRPKGHVLVMDELEAVVDAAVAGLGVTVTSVDNVLAQLRDGRLVQLLETHAVSGPSQRSSQVIIQYAPLKHLPYNARLLVEFLVSKLKDRDPLDLLNN